MLIQIILLLFCIHNGLKHNLDINECEMDPCNVNADCTDTSGSFNCTCRHGYTGDGFTCDGMLK